MEKYTLLPVYVLEIEELEKKSKYNNIEGIPWNSPELIKDCCGMRWNITELQFHSGGEVPHNPRNPDNLWKDRNLYILLYSIIFL